MTLFEAQLGQPTSRAKVSSAEYRGLYQQLYDESEIATASATVFLQQQLERVAAVDCELPQDPQQLSSWMLQRCARVAREYADYLKQRQAGAARRYFLNKAHALYFIQRVAPTKRVDGAWLHGLLDYWQDHRFDELLNTYLEELGEGDAGQNHVVIYSKLLKDHDCDSAAGLRDEHYLQGALQLALGRCGAAFVPEVIGYNLGYEQLPLHLLISAYELSELGIDPYYFTLHVTIDNASSGHAHKAVQSLMQLLPMGRGRNEFYRRVSLGYRLNDLGQGTIAVINSFDLHCELVAMLERKRAFGQHMHSNYCKFEGKTVNQWLSHPGQVEGFLEALEHKGWINRNQDPRESRFWQLIEGTGPAMFGVFSGYEKQLLHDWIAGDWRSPQRVVPIRRGGVIKPLPKQQAMMVDPDILALDDALRGLPDAEQLVRLIPWMAARRHWRPAGLYATRRFIQLRARMR